MNGTTNEKKETDAGSLALRDRAHGDALQQVRPGRTTTTPKVLN